MTGGNALARFMAEVVTVGSNGGGFSEMMNEVNLVTAVTTVPSFIKEKGDIGDIGKVRKGGEVVAPRPMPRRRNPVTCVTGRVRSFGVFDAAVRG